jgi:hypothetical protein
MSKLAWLLIPESHPKQNPCEASTIDGMKFSMPTDGDEELSEVLDKETPPSASVKRQRRIGTSRELRRHFLQQKVRKRVNGLRPVTRIPNSTQPRENWSWNTEGTTYPG